MKWPCWCAAGRQNQNQSWQTWRIRCSVLDDAFTKKKMGDDAVSIISINKNRLWNVLQYLITGQQDKQMWTPERKMYPETLASHIGVPRNNLTRLCLDWTPASMRNRVPLASRCSFTWNCCQAHGCPPSPHAGLWRLTDDSHIQCTWGDRIVQALHPF